MIPRRQRLQRSGEPKRCVRLRFRSRRKPLRATTVSDALVDRHRDAVRADVWARSEGGCEYCGDNEAQTAAKHPARDHDLHEVLQRSKTQGLPPEQRFSVEICGRACRLCHLGLGQRVGGRLFSLSFHDPVASMQGDYDVLDFRSGAVLFEMRRAVQSRVRASGANALPERAPRVLSGVPL